MPFLHHTYNSTKEKKGKKEDEKEKKRKREEGKGKGMFFAKICTLHRATNEQPPRVHKAVAHQQLHIFE